MDSFPPPSTGQAFLRDTLLNGFGLRITYQGSKSFIVEKRINGKVRRMTLGRYGELTVEQARREAQKLLGKVAQGTDPIAEKVKARKLSTTLEQAFKEFKSARKSLKSQTLSDYERMLSLIFPDWQKKPLKDITKAMVAKRHRELGENRGPAYANYSMRFLRSLYNFAKATYEDEDGNSLLYENPVSILTATRSWYKLKPKQTVIKAYEIKDWFKAVNDLKKPESPTFDHMVADYLLLVLFSGLRRQEAAQLLWKNVDLKEKTILIPDPKNHEPLKLPLSDFLFELLIERKELAVNEYVFPGKDGKGYLIEPKNPIKKVIKQSSVQFTIHDLRRTFITIADSLDISSYTIKRLVNHKINNDVTAGYIVSDIERFRNPMQKITNKILELSNENPREKIISMEVGRRKQKTLEAV